ncbi:MAG: aminoacyl-tRNA hydrolase [Candidatus Bipolaricaulota bacterium]|nr:aminoacyl-tRNA hydrolase [Candidatus Bipolaricaulota bacterium]MDW8126736.1 aminoacyl-tRNA hydrolase [Candidatus Bipolaricaulota bacterium]
MRAVVGLGNPGPTYAATRHNLGFWVLERLLKKNHWTKEIFPWGEVFQKGEALLLRPLTFMNLSGQAVAELCRRFSLSPGELLIVYDDVDLPLGEVRLRPAGGPGTHRGMQSVLFALGTEDVPRLRIGIGAPPPNTDLRDFVLSPPKPEEALVLAEACDFAAELASIFLENGLSVALDAFSRRRPARPV